MRVIDGTARAVAYFVTHLHMYHKYVLEVLDRYCHNCGKTDKPLHVLTNKKIKHESETKGCRSIVRHSLVKLSGIGSDVNCKSTL